LKNIIFLLLLGVALCLANQSYQPSPVSSNCPAADAQVGGHVVSRFYLTSGSRFSTKQLLLESDTVGYALAAGYQTRFSSLVLQYRDNTTPNLTDPLYGPNPPMFQVTTLYTNPAAGALNEAAANVLLNANPDLQALAPFKPIEATALAVSVADCATFDSGNFYFDTKWNLLNTSRITGVEVLHIFNKYFAHKLAKLPGYDSTFFDRVFDGSVTVTAVFTKANSAFTGAAMITDFVAKTNLNKDIVLDYSIVGQTLTTLPPLVNPNWSYGYASAPTSTPAPSNSYYKK
jgi:hypothetical protein